MVVVVVFCLPDCFSFENFSFVTSFSYGSNFPLMVVEFRSIFAAIRRIGCKIVKICTFGYHMIKFSIIFLLLLNVSQIISYDRRANCYLVASNQKREGSGLFIAAAVHANV